MCTVLRFASLGIREKEEEKKDIDWYYSVFILRDDDGPNHRQRDRDETSPSLDLNALNQPEGRIADKRPQFGLWKKRLEEAENSKGAAPVLNCCC